VIDGVISTHPWSWQQHATLDLITAGAAGCSHPVLPEIRGDKPECWLLDAPGLAVIHLKLLRLFELGR
jgi:hypothetical protein